jgi:hypothetical protein
MKIKSLNQHLFMNNRILEFETDDMSVLNVYPAGHYIDKGLCRVMEQQKEQVGNVFISNNSDDYLLFTDMDILVGANQNRVVNVSTLVKPHSKADLEVSCVEKDRWQHSGSDFTPSGQSMDPEIRQRKLNVISAEEESSNYKYMLQSEIWNEVSKCIRDTDRSNPTSDYHKFLQEEKEEQTGKEIPTFQPDLNGNGLAVFVDNKLRNVEVFANTALYQYYFQKIAGHYLAIAQNASLPNLSEDIMIKAIEKEIGMCLLFNAGPGKNGVGSMRYMEAGIRNGFQLSYDGERIHELVFVDQSE